MHSRTRAFFSSIGLALGLVLAVAIAYGCSGPPLSAFQSSVSGGAAPLTVSFTNQSKNADSYEWDFGDGQKQTTAKLTDTASHRYTRPGIFTVTMTASKMGKTPQTSSAMATVTVAPGPLASVAITPAQATLTPQTNQPFTAQAKDEFGNVINDQQFTFKADDKAGRIDTSGAFVAGKKAGSYTGAVTVEAVQGGTTKSVSADIVVTPGPLDHVVLNSASATLNIGKSQDFSASAYDAFNNPITDARFAWSADSRAGTVVNGTLTAGTTAGTFDKAITVTATPGSPAGSQMATASASLVVKPDPLDSITAQDAQSQAGAALQLAATAKDKYGNLLSDVQFAWTVKDDNGGTISSAGLLTAGMVAGSFPGAIGLTGTQGGIVKTAISSVTIVPAALSQVVVGPDQIDLGMGMTQQFVAVGADQYGNRISGLSFTWSVEAGGGVVDSKGLFTASSRAGTYNKTVEAIASQRDVTQSGTANVTVEPDRIAFFSKTDNPEGDLYVMNSNGANIVRISRGTTGTSLVASWSPDGRRLAMDIADPTTKKSSILIYDDKGDSAFVISGTQDASEPAWSPDGKRIAYTGVIDGHVEIFVMDIDGGNITRLTNNTADDYMPAWSPDGKQVAFVSERDGPSKWYGPDGPAQIYVMNADGSGQRRLVKSDTWDTHPSWSPDGKRILFQTDALLYVWSIRVINVDSSGLTQLTPDTLDADYPSWSPDGKEIVFHSWWDSAHPGVYMMSADGTGLTRISGAVSKDYAPVWAPRKLGVEMNETSIIIPNAESLKPLTTQHVVDQTQKAVVRIETDLAKGSGFIIDPNGLIMTANHMVTNAGDITVYLSDGTKYTATVKGRDLVRDIALLKIKASGLPFLKLGDLSQTSLGQQVLVLGYALGSTDLTVTSGLLSSLKNNPSRNVTWVQTDAAINPGDSGGPILNLQGEVIGVVTWKWASTAIEGMGYAVSVNTIDIYMDRLKDGETIFQ